MKKGFLILILAFLAVLSADAKVKLPSVISDNMVLQRNTEVDLWGTAEAGAKVIVEVSWKKGKTVAYADSEGKWSIKVSTPDAGGPYTISFDDGEKVVLGNILIGEVWICSGQSNMEMKMRGFNGQPIEGAADIILGAVPDVPIRMCNLKMTRSLKVEDDCEAFWAEHTPAGVRETSATAYYFARKIYEILRIPVGIVHASWGGSPIQAWMDKELLDSEFVGEFDMTPYETGKFPEKHPHKVAGVLYNGMLNSIIPFTAKGFIWYQGCDNRRDPEQYKRLQPAFVKMLREKWGNDQMPFYYTQIAPFKYDGWQKRQAGYMMWAQAQCLDLIPLSGMAATHDVGEFDCIHPRKKKEVGDRLAYLALTQTYGYDGLIGARTPVARKFDFKDGMAYVTFEVDKMGLSPINMDLEGFELAGPDGIFHPAKARVINNKPQIKVFSEEVTEPAAVRYGIRNWSEAVLFNCWGIPVSPFRSDNYEMVD